MEKKEKKKKEEDDLGNNKSLRLLRVHIWCSASEPLEVQRDCLQEQIDFLSSFFFFFFYTRRGNKSAKFCLVYYL